MDNRFVFTEVRLYTRDCIEKFTLKYLNVYDELKQRQFCTSSFLRFEDYSSSNDAKNISKGSKTTVKK